MVGWSTQGGGKAVVQVSQAPHWCIQGGLVEHVTHKGGAANYLCMPDDPDYLSYQSGVQGYSYVYRVEYWTYEGPLRAVHDHNVPCAVC